MKKRTLIQATFILTLVVSGCSSFEAPKPNLANGRTNSLSTTAIGDLSGQPTIAGDYVCPTGSQITPIKQPNSQGSGTYQVCTHRTNPAKILMHGKTFGGSGICIIPLRMSSNDINTSKSAAYLDSQGAPIMVCSQVAPGGVSFTPDATLYNALFVSDINDGNAMSWCVKNPATSCPASISWGVFR